MTPRNRAIFLCRFCDAFEMPSKPIRLQSRSCIKSLAMVCLLGSIIFIILSLLQSRSNMSINNSHCHYTSTIVNNTILFDSPSYLIYHYPEFVCPQNFRNLADWIYGWPKLKTDETLEYPTNESCFNLPHGSIVYVTRRNLTRFFSEIYPHIRQPFVLITGQGDASTPRHYLHHLRAPDSKIIHWFGQNADIDSTTSAKFTPIPIGTFLSLSADSTATIV